MIRFCNHIIIQCVYYHSVPTVYSSHQILIVPCRHIDLSVLYLLHIPSVEWKPQQPLKYKISHKYNSLFWSEVEDQKPPHCIQQADLINMLPNPTNIYGYRKQWTDFTTMPYIGNISTTIIKYDVLRMSYNHEL